MAHWQPIDWMFLGYSVMWAAIVLYVVNLQRRQATVQREVRAIRAALEGGQTEAGGQAQDAGALAPRSR